MEKPARILVTKNTREWYVRTIQGFQKRVCGRKFFCFPFKTENRVTSEQTLLLRVQSVNFNSITFSSQWCELFRSCRDDHMPALHSRKSKLILFNWKSHQIVSWKPKIHRQTAARGSWFRADCPSTDTMTLHWHTRTHSNEKRTISHTNTHQRMHGDWVTTKWQRSKITAPQILASFICKWEHCYCPPDHPPYSPGTKS